MLIALCVCNLDKREPAVSALLGLRMHTREHTADVQVPFASPPELAEDEIHLWLLSLEQFANTEQHWRGLLASEERSRAERFHFTADRLRYTVTRGILRTVLAGYIGGEACGLTFRYSDTGKPSLASPHSAAEIRFSVTHSGGVALLAFAMGFDIGVDVEELRQNFDLQAIATRFFSPREQQELAAYPPEQRCEAFFRCWTRKEAYIKATGEGLSVPLQQFDVSLKPADVDCLLATRPDERNAEHWWIQDVSASIGYAAALCGKGRSWALKRFSGLVLT
jgi:4'-phosphopantetheinyl transferase